MNENQMQQFVDFEQEPSDDDISTKKSVGGFATTTTSKVHEEPLENYMGGSGSDINLVNCENFDAISILTSLYEDEMNENQR